MKKKEAHHNYVVCFLYAQIDLITNPKLRAKHIDRVEVLDRVGGLLLLPNTELATTKQVAEFYGVPINTIYSLININRKELESNGMENMGYLELKGLENQPDIQLSKRGATVFNMRTILLVGFMLRDSKVALEVRNQALNIIESASTEHKTFEITKEKELLMAIMFAPSEVERATAGLTQEWKAMRRNLGIASGDTNLYPKQAVLLIGFMLEDSEVADKVRKLVLANDDILPVKAEPVNNVGAIVVPNEQPKTTELQVVNHDEQLVSDSRDVAEMVGRNHKEVLRDIRKIIEHLSNGSKIALVEYFMESTYQDSKGEPRNCYLLTKKGCELFATRMTGAKGTQFAVTYIEKFNQMEEQLKSQAVVPVHSYMIENPIERAKMWIVEQEEKMLLEVRVQEQNEVIEEQAEMNRGDQLCTKSILDACKDCFSEYKWFARNNEKAHSIISARLEALLFIVDLDSMVDCSAYLMRSFKAIQRNTNKINDYKKRKKNKLLADIKSVAKLNRFNFELAYSNNRSNLTEPFNEPVSVDMESEQLA